MPLPNFFVIGAMKAGTTALYYNLKQHPQIFMSPVKEPNFFALEGQDSYTTLEWDEYSYTDFNSYCSLFDNVRNEIAIGEASHSYLYIPSAHERICRIVPHASFICILRNPVDRAYSHYLYLLRDGWEPITNFERALEEEETRIKNNIPFGHYFRRGLYYQQLKWYFDSFDPSRIKIYLYEEFTQDPARFTQKMYQFLGVNSDFIPDASIRRNPSGIPKNKLIHALFVKPNPLKAFIQPFLPDEMYRLATRIRDRNLVKPELSFETRRALLERYREDILNLQDLLQRDLSVWLQ